MENKAYLSFKDDKTYEEWVVADIKKKETLIKEQIVNDLNQENGRRFVCFFLLFFFMNNPIEICGR